MKLGIVGKPSSGKTTFFDSATLASAEIASYPFTTIQPNLGTGFVRFPCPHREIGRKCNPRNAPCVDGTRFIPITLLDVAGLVPGAHEGRGLGNQFLDDLMDAQALVHVVDASGLTDAEGNPTKGHDPMEDVEFLEDEIDHWLWGLIRRNWEIIKRKARMKAGKLEDLVYDQLSGLGMDREEIARAIEEVGVDPSSGDDKLLELARDIRRRNKPIIIAANKIDLEEAKENFKRMKRELGDQVIPVSAEAELALKRADKAGLIKYIPGSGGFDVLKPLSDKQRKALDYIKENVLDVYGSTGVQEVLEKAVFQVLGMIAVFPVEDENKWTDKQGNVLPDVLLMEPGSRAIDLAYRIHTDIGERFIGAIDARTKKKIGKDYELKNGDVIKIIARTR